MNQVPTIQELEHIQNSSEFHPHLLCGERRSKERRMYSKSSKYRRGRRSKNRRKIPKVLKMQPVLNHGHVALLGVFGTDTSIADSARVSYDKGTTKVSNDENLLRYLVRHKHTSPLEQAEVRFQIKLPIFVMRQLVRHRSANLNELSARYSEMEDNFYVPSFDFIQKQSNTNKQGRGDDLSDEEKKEVQKLISQSNDYCYSVYAKLLDMDVARELARTVLNVGIYTKIIWKCDLHNFFHFLKLRMDSHAQKEIRVIAELMYAQVKDCFPKSCKAFEDYILDAKTYSKQERILIAYLLSNPNWTTEMLQEKAKELDMSKREISDFRNSL